MFFVPRTVPMASAVTTNASHPKVADFQWFALHRPMRAAMLRDGARGVIAVSSLVGLVCCKARRRQLHATGGCHASAWCGWQHPCDPTDHEKGRPEGGPGVPSNAASTPRMRTDR